MVYQFIIISLWFSQGGILGKVGPARSHLHPPVAHRVRRVWCSASDSTTPGFHGKCLKWFMDIYGTYGFLGCFWSLLEVQVCKFSNPSFKKKITARSSHLCLGHDFPHLVDAFEDVNLLLFSLSDVGQNKHPGPKNIQHIQTSYSKL